MYFLVEETCRRMQAVTPTGLYSLCHHGSVLRATEDVVKLVLDRGLRALERGVGLREWAADAGVRGALKTIGALLSHTSEHPDNVPATLLLSAFN